MTEPATLAMSTLRGVVPEDQVPVASARPEIQVTAPQMLDLPDIAANDPDDQFVIDETDPRHAQTRLFLRMELPDVFNESAAPPGVEHSFAQLSMATQMSNAYGEATIGVQGGGALYTEETDFYEDFADDNDDVDSKGKKRKGMGPSMKDIAEEIRRMDECARQWDAKIHTIGGQQITGAELKKRSDYVLDPRNNKKIEEDLITNEGLTPEQARQRREQMQELAKLLEKERIGKITEEERRRLQALKDGPAGQSMSQLKAEAVEFGQVDRKLLGKTEDSFRQEKVIGEAFSLPLKASSAQTYDDTEVALRLLRESREITSGAQGNGILVSKSQGPQSSSASIATSVNANAIKANLDLTTTYNDASTHTEPAVVLAVANTQPKNTATTGSKVIQVADLGL